VAALTTLTTGLPPLSHGMIGYRLYLREVGAITNMVRFSLVGSNHNGSAIEAGLDVDRLLPGRTFYERLRDRKIATHVLLPRAIAGSGLSKVLYRGCSHVHPTSSIGDMCVGAREILREVDGPSLLTLYWPGLDAVAHSRGPQSDSYLAEARAIDAAIGRELVGQLDRTLLVITSDHGFVPMDPGDYIPLEDLDGLGEAALLPPVGEPRASYLFLRHAANPVGASSLDEPKLLRGEILRLTTDQVLTSGLLGAGDLHPEIRRRLGDLVLASTGSAGIVHPYPDAAILRGMHGGLSAEEMLVPLVAVSL
jgi:predicted AlkP superfamily pyrophosphatase or phosphodiesterase